MKTEDEEFTSMIDYAVALIVREVIGEYIAKKTGYPLNECRHELMKLVKDQHDAPENIRIWFEKNI